MGDCYLIKTKAGKKNMKNSLKKILSIGLAVSLFLQTGMMVFAESVDLSKSVYFPPIQNASTDTITSIAFAAAYYQYTYEVNRMKGIASNSSSRYYSPAWVKNYIDNIQPNYKMDIAYDRLESKGCLSWAEMPFTGNSARSQDEKAMMRALSTRIANYHSISVVGAESSSDIRLEMAKLLVKDNKVLAVQIPSDGDLKNVSFGTAQNGEKIIYRVGKTEEMKDQAMESQAMVVVGYDDDIAIDVNHDGRIQNAERGAFKLAAAKGTSWGNKGYIWVLYDALNKESNITGDWQRGNKYARCSCFDAISFGSNRFYYINVEEKKVDLISKISFNKSSSVCNTLVKCGRTSKIGNNNVYDTITQTGNHVVINDISDTNLEKISVYYTGLEERGENMTTVSNVKCEIKDDAGNILYSNRNVSRSINEKHSQYLMLTLFDFKRGDVNRDGKITVEDAQIVLKISLNTIASTNLEKTLADYKLKNFY